MIFGLLILQLCFLANFWSLFTIICAVFATRVFLSQNFMFCESNAKYLIIKDLSKFKYVKKTCKIKINLSLKICCKLIF